mmetsp:Transcript_24364/g.67411  ORF Transcript_24364/g.67411 Transcript_24364/m.67411 type:complete len:332 (-) Transcript_24364:1946-2941(-)
MVWLVQAGVFVHVYFVGVSRSFVPFDRIPSFSQQYPLVVMVRRIFTLLEVVSIPQLVGHVPIQSKIERVKSHHDGTGGHRSENSRNVIIKEPLVVVLARTLRKDTVKIIYVRACYPVRQKVLLIRILQPSESQIDVSYFGTSFESTVVFGVHASPKFLCNFVSIRNNFDSSGIASDAKGSMQARIPYTVTYIKEYVVTAKFENLHHFLHCARQYSSILRLYLSIGVHRIHRLVCSLYQSRIFYFIHSFGLFFKVLPHIEKLLVGVCRAICIVIRPAASVRVFGIVRIAERRVGVVIARGTARVHFVRLLFCSRILIRIVGYFKHRFLLSTK